MKHEVEIYTCDRCGAETTQPMSRLARRIGFWAFGWMQERDVCVLCRKEFDDWWFRPKACPIHGHGKRGEGR